MGGVGGDGLPQRSSVDMELLLTGREAHHGTFCVRSSATHDVSAVVVVLTCRSFSFCVFSGHRGQLVSAAMPARPCGTFFGLRRWVQGSESLVAWGSSLDHASRSAS